MKQTAKKLLAIILSVTTVLMCLNLPTFNNKTLAAESKTTEDGFVYEIDEEKDTVTITKYSGSAAVVEIPGKIEGKTVTTIGANAFSNCSSLTSVIIPEGVTTIGTGAFFNCMSLTSITIPEGVTTIGVSAFNRCSGLTSITIPEGVNTIGASAFNSCSGLTSISIPEGVTTIGNRAFYGCSGLTSITIPKSVTTIGEGAFSKCNELECITVDEDNKTYCSIGNSTVLSKDKTTLVWGCKETIIPEGVTTIGTSAFSGCSGLTSIIIPEGVTTIGNSAFFECSDLTSISIPEGVTTIGASAFSYCSGLTSISIPEGVTTIGTSAFDRCGSLEEVTAPCSLDLSGTGLGSCTITRTHTVVPTSITTKATKKKMGTGTGDCVNCSEENVNGYIASPATIELVEDATPYYTGEEVEPVIVVKDKLGNEISSDYYTVSYYDNVNIGTAIVTVTFKEDTEEFKNLYAGTLEGTFNIWSPLSDFSYSTTETAVTITEYEGSSEVVVIPAKIDGKPVTKIDEKAFYGCEDLTSVTIPGNVTTIDCAAFCDCTSLEEINFSEGLTTICEEAFGECSSLKKLSIPKSVTDIEVDAFYGCSSIESIVVDEANTEYCSDNKNAIFSKDKTTLILGCKNTAIPDTVTTIGNSAFSYCSGLEEIILPKNLTMIDNYAFVDCNNLKKINIPDGVSAINYGTFSGCSSLTSITIPSSVTTIGGCAFEGCSGLEEIVIPNSVTTIGGYAFEGCSSLEEIIISKGVITIGESAFEGCSSLEEIVIPNSVTTIGESAFEGCSSLEEIVIPNSVTTIGYYVFYDCPNLTIYVDYADRIDTVKEMTGIDNVVVCSHTGGTATHTTLAVCEKCGASYGETVPHNYTTDVEVKTKASSTTAGTVTKKCECGAEKDFTIAKPSEIELTQSSYTYTGSAIKPSVVVKDTDGKTISANNYTINYNNNIIGKATVSVTFKGNYYEGTLQTVSFTISPSKTSISSITNVATGITINWAKNSKATGYAIYRSVNNGAYTKLTTVGTVTSYTDTKATTGGAKYAYKVVVLYKDSTGTTYTSDYSAEKSLTRIGKANITSVKNEVKGVTINWSKVAGANKYQVFRRTVGNGWVTGWTWLKDTTGTSFTDTTAENGKTYEYVIKPLYDKQNGVLSAGKTIKRVEAPKTITVAKATNGIKVTWAKVTGTTKYQVFRKTIGNGWETGWSWVKDTTGTSFTDTTAKVGTTYVYCVKAIVGNYSTAFTSSAKIKR